MEEPNFSVIWGDELRKKIGNSKISKLEIVTGDFNEFRKNAVAFQQQMKRYQRIGFQNVPEVTIEELEKLGAAKTPTKKNRSSLSR